jgi:hypothetical protein
MRKSMAIFIAATIGSAAAGSNPAAATVWDWCSIGYNNCARDCENSLPFTEAQRIAACRKGCAGAHHQCQIRQSVTIPVDDAKPKRLLSVTGRPPKTGSPSPGSGMPKPGILDNSGPVLGSQGPSATGSPLAPRPSAAPPVIIR